MKKYQPGNCSPRYVRCRHVRLEKHRIKRGNKGVDRSPGYADGKEVVVDGVTIRKIVELPKVFSLIDNYHGSIRKINEIRNLDKKQSGYIDFDNIEKIGVDAALVLAAELDTAKINTADKKAWTRATDGNWLPEVRELLHDIGFYDLLKLKRDVKDNTGREDPDEKFLKFRSKEVEYDNMGLIIVQIIDEIYRLTGEILMRGDAFTDAFTDAITEAITNTDHHAYAEHNRRRQSSRWWVSASLNKVSNEIKIICYDTGRSIPMTLRANLKDYIKTLLALVGKFQNRHDPLLIETAIKKSKSSTKKSGRGLGLIALKKFIDQSDKGSLIVMSRYGKVTYQKSAGEKTWSQEKLPEKIRGTLIIWSIMQPETSYENINSR